MRDRSLSVVRLGSDRVCVLSVHGVLDWGTAEHFDSEAARALESQPPLLVLDLRSVSILDFTGAESLSIACETAARNGGRGVVVNAPSTSIRVLRLAGLTTAVPVHFIDGPHSMRSVFGSDAITKPEVISALAASLRARATNNVATSATDTATGEGRTFRSCDS